MAPCPHHQTGVIHAAAGLIIDLAFAASWGSGIGPQTLGPSFMAAGSREAHASRRLRVPLLPRHTRPQNPATRRGELYCACAAQQAAEPPTGRRHLTERSKKPALESWRCSPIPPVPRVHLCAAPMQPTTRQPTNTYLQTPITRHTETNTTPLGASKVSWQRRGPHTQTKSAAAVKSTASPRHLHLRLPRPQRRLQEVRLPKTTTVTLGAGALL